MSPHLHRPTKGPSPAGWLSPVRSIYTPCLDPVSFTEEPLPPGCHLIPHFDPSRQTSWALWWTFPQNERRHSAGAVNSLIRSLWGWYYISICGLLYLGRKMALWRKFSKTFKKTRSPFSRSFSSGVFWQAQHGPFSAPARSDLVGFVLSSMSVSPVAGIRIGIFSSVFESNQECLVTGGILHYQSSY